MRDQCRGKRGGNLWLRERPDRELFIPVVAKRAPHAPGGNPLADEQSTDDADNEQEVVENPVNKGDRVDQESGNDKEDRNEQRFTHKLKLDTSWRVLCRGVDGQTRKERTHDARQLNRSQALPRWP